MSTNMSTMTRHGKRRTKPKGIEMEELPLIRIRRLKKESFGTSRPFSPEKSLSDGKLGDEGIRFFRFCTRPIVGNLGMSQTLKYHRRFETFQDPSCLYQVATACSSVCSSKSKENERWSQLDSNLIRSREGEVGGSANERLAQPLRDCVGQPRGQQPHNLQPRGRAARAETCRKSSRRLGAFVGPRSSVCCLRERDFDRRTDGGSVSCRDSRTEKLRVAPLPRT